MSTQNSLYPIFVKIHPMLFFQWLSNTNSMTLFAQILVEQSINWLLSTGAVLILKLKRGILKVTKSLVQHTCQSISPALFISRPSIRKTTLLPSTTERFEYPNEVATCEIIEKRFSRSSNPLPYQMVQDEWYV